MGVHRDGQQVLLLIGWYLSIGAGAIGADWSARPQVVPLCMLIAPFSPLQKDLSYLQQWLEAFVMNFEKIIALPSLEPRRPEEPVSEIPVLPQEVLQVLSQRLGHCVAQVPREEGGGASLGQALLLLKFFIIICREIISAKEKSKYKFAPAPLPPEFGAFFQESFQAGAQLPETLQLRLIHLFGAILSGSKPNALRAITPAAVEVLLGVLQRGGGGPPPVPRLLELALRGVVAVVHVLHGSSPGAGPVPLRVLLDGYFRVLNLDLPVASLAPEAASGLVALRVLMLDAIPAMLSCEDRPVLQAVFLSNNCFEHIIRLLQNSKLYLSSSQEAGEARNEVPVWPLNGDGLQQVFDSSSDAIAVHAVRVLTAIMSNSPSAKEVFKERIGYAHLYEVLKSQGQPTQCLLQELLNMAVEGDHSSFPVRPIRNEQPLLILLAWLPALACWELQIFLSGWLRRLCEASLPSRLTCVKAGMVGSLLSALATEPALPAACSENLLELLRALGSLSICPRELRQLLQLLRHERGRGPHPYVAPVIRALSGMARVEGPPRALQCFDLTPGMAGIMVPTIQKWPGSAFAFHAWLCLSEEEPEPTARPKRRQLYSFFTAGGTGLEAFFTAGGVLVVAVCTKKDYMTVALPEFAFNDSSWHCIDIVHVAGRRPFGQNIVSIYTDGHLRKTAQLRFPSLHESFTSCCIGSAGHRTTTTTATTTSHPPTSHGPELVFPPHPTLGRSQSVPAALGPHTWTPTQPPTEGVVATTAAGSQDTEWGSPTSLEGHLGSVAIFCEALQQAQVKALFCTGPNITSPFALEGDLVELSSKLLLYYTPQACRNNICLDLSPSHGLDGRLTGHKVVNWDIKDVVNCVGGMGVLLPLLEQVVSKKEEPEDEQETNDLVGPELTSSRNAQGLLIPLGKSSESRLERNSVAAFLLLVKNFIQNHLVNQESLVQCHGPAIIGALLQKVSSPLLDMSTLMASQILMEQVASEGSGLLLHLLYQHLLFDFRIWSNSDFAVRLGHIQYLANIVKDHKQRIRKKYGVQYILDSIRTYYGTSREKTTATDDIKTVQTSLFSLVKDFFCRSFSGEEMQSLLSYVAGAQDEQQVCGALEVIHSLLKGSPAQEQLFAFLFEPGHVEVLFSLLVQKKFSDKVRERVFKILYKMLKYEKVPERSKNRLKLKDIGYQGLIACLSDVPTSMLLFRCLSEQVLGADPPNYKDLVAVVYLSHRAELTVRLDICRKLFHLIYAQQDMVRQLARLAGWQDTLTKLYVKESYESRQHSLSNVGNGGCLELLRLSDPSGKEGVSPPLAELQELDVFLPLGYEASDQELSEGFSDHSISPSGRTKSFHSYNFKSFDSSDRASRSSSNPGDGPPFDGVYHPLSPFSTSPFDLGLDLASTSSIATAESDTHTPTSGPGTPSPLESFKPFPGMRARKSSSLSNVLDESSYQDALPSDNVSNTSNPQQTPEEELCNLLTNIIFSVTWRGVEGWDDVAWRERGQVFSVLTKLGTACELVRPPDEIKRSLLEMMLESALTDLKESGPAALPSLTHNALKLLRLLQDFLFSEGHNNQALWSEKIYEGVSSLLDKLGVWYHLANGTSDLKEMAQTGLRILIGYIMLQDPQLHSLAYVKLHSLLQTASAPKNDEACYLLGKLETPLRRSLDAKSETTSWLVPIVRTLMDQCYETLQLQLFLPSLPPTNGSPTFYEDFQLFCTTPEWRAFIEKHVQPTMAQFEMDTFAKSHDHMSNFWNACYDAMMSSSQRREQEKAASRKMFQELVLEPVAKRSKAENARHTNMLKQANNHHGTVLKQWWSLCRLLTSPRSAWADRNPPEVRWKLSSAETYSRMRLKLVPNLNFDQHLEASALRDNLGELMGLTNPAVFRDLSKPIGVANERHARDVKEKYESFEDPTGTVDKFHYGTHYSNAAGVMHYLIRTEPFTTLHIQLQSGRFDCSDRQFHSVPAAWQARMENPVDVKELIPEFFYFPEFLENQNGFDLGCLQLSNEKVGDVVLPRWARSREDFIYQHRKALESEYVSAHLHEWIDLIFGYKQRGPAAVEALNVFYYCTYEGAVDLDAIADETQRKALEGIISNFGQTPCQLLKEPHPARLSAESAAQRLSRLDTRSPNVFENLDQLKSFFVEGISDGVALVQAVVPKNQAHSFITQGSPDVLVTVSANGLLGTHNWLPYDKNISNYFSFTKDPTVSNTKTQRFLQGPFAPGADLCSRTLAVSPDGKLLFSGGHWDNSLRVTSLAKGKVVGHITRHIDVVTCLALDLCGIYLISGSRDTTCMVWQVLQQGGFSSGLAPKPVQVLYGHDAEVTCVAISTELDMAVSGSKDGTIITHTIRRGLFIRSLRPPGESSPPAVLSHLAVGLEGQVVAQTTVGQRACLKDRFALHLYSVNGKHLSSVPLDEEVTAMCLTEDFVVLGTMQCGLEIRDLQSLRAAVPPVPMRVPVHSVSVTKEKSHILVGLEDGKLIVVGAGQPAEVSVDPQLRLRGGHASVSSGC
ncbi:neurobeachin-like protein 2 [Athene cunicularia]|uniref:neurobeachin-like protein 2 n=1 Tax=Athene cunicularia TaxID=194338 RepID=UPI000EF69D22|nr:neurobeachin-like protein 2 [Athene cunicularia]